MTNGPSGITRRRVAARVLLNALNPAAWPGHGGLHAMKAWDSRHDMHAAVGLTRLCFGMASIAFSACWCSLRADPGFGSTSAAEAATICLSFLVGLVYGIRGIDDCKAHVDG